jgi:menaquinone-dependent protoporphyrinogen oxidase
MKILLTFSSGYGTTREVSEEISKILKGEKTEVDVQSIDDVQSIESYDCVIVGSSVRADKPLANVRDFFSVNNIALRKKKVAVFAVCLLANNEEGREKVKQEYLAPFLEKYPEIHPIGIEAFGGKIDFDKLNPVMQSLMKRVLEKTGLATEGSIDTRDWDFIKNWAKKIKAQLDA